MPNVQPTVETPSQIWDRNWMEYGQLMAASFKSEKLTLESLAKTQSFRECLLNTYNVLVRWQMIDKLEDQPEETKESLRGFIRSFHTLKKQKDMIEFSKSLLVIETLLK